MNTLQIRLISACIALAIFFSTYFYFEQKGLWAMCFLSSVLLTRELNRIFFSDKRKRLQTQFFILTLLTFLIIAVPNLNPNLKLIFFLPVVPVVNFIFCILQQKEFESLSDLLSYAVRSFFGFFYVGALPALATCILFLPNGMSWFVVLLAIVFVGDTCALLAGYSFGKSILIERISPKKTLAGACGGLIGSALAGAICVMILIPGVSILKIAGLALIVGLVAQVGDFFESMLKRVANKKDSGTLMPGHGGVLDRLDGVLFAIPIFLIGIWYL